MPSSQLPSLLSRRIRGVLFVLLGTVMAWLVITRSFGAWLAVSSPETALLLRSNDAAALVELSQSWFSQKQPAKGDEKKAITKTDIGQISKWINKALRDEPLNPKAIRILGQIAKKNGDETSAEKFMTTAVNMSIRESLAAFWLMQKSYQQKDYDAALRYADMLLWHHPKLTKHITPMLAAIAEKTDARAKLEVLLAKKPNWRGSFFGNLPRSVTDARTPLNLLLSLRKTSAPPDKWELRSYMDFLSRKKLYDLAYYSWLQFLPPKHVANAGFLFNGSFEIEPDGMPFNWTIRKGENVTINMLPRPDNPSKRALNIKLSHGRVKFGGMRQTLVLSPGRHIFKGRLKGEFTGRRGLRWRISCLGKHRPTRIGQSPMFVGTQPNWKQFKIDFTVPYQGCSAQRIILVLDARTASEKLVTGDVWYDDLKIVPNFTIQEALE